MSLPRILTMPGALRRRGAIVMAALLPLLLGACLFSPGRFTSSLDIRRDGQFSFSYTGQIYVLSLSRLAQRDLAERPFAPETCYDDRAKERDCTPEELAEQKTEWASREASRREKAKRDIEQARQFLGDIDPSDPKAAEDLAARLRRQVGWKSVVYKGDGLFEVDYAIAGRLDHDFVFPAVERAPDTPFIQLSRRTDGSVVVDASGYGPDKGANPLTSMMTLGMDKSEGKQEPGSVPVIVDGTFTVTTDGAVMANNTEDGPSTGPTGQTLFWRINARSTPPRALIGLTRQTPPGSPPPRP